MKHLLALFPLFFLLSCGSYSSKDQSGTIISMQIIDRNGFTETMSSKDRLSSFQSVDFLSPQPYQKVLRVFGKNNGGQTSSQITSYHSNGHIWQLLNVLNGRAYGLYQEWFSNGQLKIEAHLIEGVADITELAQATWVFDGINKVFDDQGALLAEFCYAKGILHTPARYYHSNGALQKIVPYNQGEVEGVVQIFDPQGNLLEETPFIRGEKQGRSMAYWTPTQLKWQEDYNLSLLVTAIYFDPSGTQIAAIQNGSGQQAQFKGELPSALISYFNGVPEGEVQLFDSKKALHCSYFIKGGKKVGEEIEYYPPQNDQAALPKLSVHWNNDKIEGQVKTWYPNGQIESQREFNGNKKQGSAFAWYKNGDLMLVEEYENDLLIKASYYKKGDKKAVSKIEAGKGIASLYSSDGIFQKKVTYDKGKPQLP